MRSRVLLCCVLAGVGLACLSAQAAYLNVLANGNFEAPGTWGDATQQWAPSWSTGNGGANWYWKQVTGRDGTGSAQHIYKAGATSSNWGGGIRQTFTGINVGDAFTLADAWVSTTSNYTVGSLAQIRVSWTGATAAWGTDAVSSVVASTTTAPGQWYHFASQPIGNATTSGVTFGFMGKIPASTTQNVSTIWDDLVIVRAYVPPAPTVPQEAASATTLNVDVNPGGNAANSDAEFAIKIGSGWVQANGTVGAAQAWLTDAAWGNKTVTGLTPNTTYQFEVLSRYSSELTLPTLSQNLTVSATTTPEPATLVLLVLGSFALLKRRG